MRLGTKQLKARTFNGILRYVWFQDLESGRAPKVYTVLALNSTVLALNSDDPVVIGRELDEKYIRGLVQDYENEAKKLQEKWSCYFGERSFVLTVRNKVSALRKKGRGHG